MDFKSSGRWQGRSARQRRIQSARHALDRAAIFANVAKTLRKIVGGVSFGIGEIADVFGFSKKMGVVKVIQRRPVVWLQRHAPDKRHDPDNLSSLDGERSSYHRLYYFRAVGLE